MDIDAAVDGILTEMKHQEHVLRTMRLAGCSDTEVKVARARINGLRDALGVIAPDHPRRSKRKP